MLPCLRLDSTGRHKKNKKVINQDFQRNEDRNPRIIRRRDVCVLSRSRIQAETHYNPCRNGTTDMRGKNQADTAQRICNKPSTCQKQHGGHKQTLKFKTIAKTLCCVKTRRNEHKKQGITELFLKPSE